MIKKIKIIFEKNGEIIFQETGWQIPIIFDALLSLTNPTNDFSLNKIFKPKTPLNLSKYGIKTTLLHNRTFVDEKVSGEIFNIGFFNTIAEHEKWNIIAKVKIV